MASPASAAMITPCWALRPSICRQDIGNRFEGDGIGVTVSLATAAVELQQQGVVAFVAQVPKGQLMLMLWHILIFHTASLSSMANACLAIIWQSLLAHVTTAVCPQGTPGEVARSTRHTVCRATLFASAHFPTCSCSLGERDKPS